MHADIQEAREVVDPPAGSKAVDARLEMGWASARWWMAFCSWFRAPESAGETRRLAAEEGGGNFSLDFGMALVGCSGFNRRCFPFHAPNVTELIQAAISPPQILLTLLLALIVCYWLLVILGALDFESDLPEGVGDGLGEGDLDTHHGGHGINTGGAWLTAGRFFGFSQVPIAVWMSFLVLFMWFFSLVFNHTWNPRADVGRALLLILPNILASAAVTKVATIPVARLFRAMADADTEAEEVVGRTGTVSSLEVDEHYGQLEIISTGAPLLVNVRISPGSGTLKKGDSARVVSAGPDNAFYFIEAA